jgi:prepilin-type N-terminal cleavage/methylation domain-containing protein
VRLRSALRWCSAVRGRSAARGFTLIEMLLAMVLLAVVVSLTYAAMFQVTSGAKYLTDEFMEDQELRLLLRMLAQDLGSVQYLKYYVAVPSAAGTPHQSGLIAATRFTGGGDFSTVDFHTAVRSRQNRQAPEGSDPLLHEVGYSVREEFSTHILQLVRREDFYIDDQMQVGGVTAVLASGIEAFRVECLQPADAPGQTTETWTQTWDSNAQTADKPKLPAAIRITLGIAGKNGRHLKETVEVNLLTGMRTG